MLTDLKAATNLHGPLTADVAARVEAFCTSPSLETWKACRTIIIRRAGLTTLWKAVCAIDAAAKDAAHVPSVFVVRRAIQTA
jgi:hypothetical protein